MKKIIIILVALLLVVLISYLVYLDSITPGAYDEVAKCLTEKGVMMAGTDWCHFCQNQKSLFGKSFKYVNYKNCDFEQEWCSANGVERYPTWVFPDGTKYLGVQSLETLGELAGCEV